MTRALKTLHEYAALYGSLALLGLICLAWTILALPLGALLPRALGGALGRRGIMLGFRLYAWSLAVTGCYRLDLRELDRLRGGPAMILAPNHPSLIDALLILTRLPDVVCVMKASLMHNVFLGAGARLARYVKNEPPRRMVRESVEHLRAGSMLLLFPEGTRTVRPPINPPLASLGLIAKHAQAPVQTLLLETDSPFLGKGWPLLRRPSLPIVFRVRLGRRFAPPADVNAFTAEIERYFRAALGGTCGPGGGERG